MRLFFTLLLDSLGQAFRSKKALIFLALYLAVFFFIADTLLKFQTAASEGLDSQGIGIKLFVTNMLRANSDSVVYNFLMKTPFINVALFLVSIFGTPILLLILNYDRVSQEIYDGTIRYLVFRAARWQIYTAKFASSVLECAMVTLIANVPALIWASFKIPKFDLGVSLTYGLRYWATAQIFLAFISAFSIMLSSFFRKPFTALVASFLGMFIMMLIPIWFDYLSPYDGNYIRGLFNNVSVELFSSLAAYLGFCVLFFGAGLLVFQRKDL